MLRAIMINFVGNWIFGSQLRLGNHLLVFLQCLLVLSFYEFNWNLNFIIFLCFIQLLNTEPNRKQTRLPFKKMSKTLSQLQQNIKNFRDQINDVLHLSYLNHQSYLCLNSTQNKVLKEIPVNLQCLEFINDTGKESAPVNISLTELNYHQNKIQNKLKNISQLFEKRASNHLNYLIVKQIQGEEQSVRRQRLTEYEQKIYDQRRLISDKEVFCESLLRPKKQRPQHMTSDQFQQMRMSQKIEQEKAKVSALENEINDLQAFRIKLLQSEQRKVNGNRFSNDVIMRRQIELNRKLKNQDLQKTKASSLETVNLSSINNINSDKPQKPFEEQQFNSDIPKTNSEDSKKTQSHDLSSVEGSISQNTLLRHKQQSKAYCSVQIQSLIKNYEKSALPEQVNQKFQRLKELLQKIRRKKLENCRKVKQWKGLQMQNIHMRTHLNNTREVYFQSTAELSKDPEVFSPVNKSSD